MHIVPVPSIRVSIVGKSVSSEGVAEELSSTI